MHRKLLACHISWKSYVMFFVCHIGSKSEFYLCRDKTENWYGFTKRILHGIMTWFIIKEYCSKLKLFFMNNNIHILYHVIFCSFVSLKSGLLLPNFVVVDKKTVLLNVTTFYRTVSFSMLVMKFSRKINGFVIIKDIKSWRHHLLTEPRCSKL